MVDLGALMQPDAEVLRTLKRVHACDGPPTSRQLSELLGAHPTSVSGALGRLEAEGLAAPVPEGPWPRGNPSRRRWRPL